MKCRKLLLLTAAGGYLAFATSTNVRKEDFSISGDEEMVSDEDAGDARFLPSYFFPFFRQYHDVDLGANLNNLKSGNTMAFFIIRDALTVINQSSQT